MLSGFRRLLTTCSLWQDKSQVEFSLCQRISESDNNITFASQINLISDASSTLASVPILLVKMTFLNGWPSLGKNSKKFLW